MPCEGVANVAIAMADAIPEASKFSVAAPCCV